GHSDADVLTHAISDALLGAGAAGDIGQHFPPDDPAYEGASSIALLASVVAVLREKNLVPASVDAVVVAEAPRLAPHIDAMRDALANALGIDRGCVSVKATTTEGMGPEGEGRAISATAVAVARPGGG
ncbi:2-C-methyl-D-erythritol 2,4-cyclodiphosphate synthase, partial [bacterium]|nr:2-C-methyl-D-erythritol 2,4-cyclodiphosphate synthase [bacterium]